MQTFKVSFVVPFDVYRIIQACAARASLAVPVFVRDIVFQACQVDASALEAMPLASTPRLTATKREMLALLLKQKQTCPAEPYLTTMQISVPLQQSDQSVYINLRALLREGLIDRGGNIQRAGNPGAPFKTYAISSFGEACLTADQGRVEKVFKEFQERSQAAFNETVAHAPHTLKPLVDPARVHNLLRYIAMAQLGRAIDSEADVDAMKATHARLCQAADSDVAAGAHTYDQILERVAAKIEALGGQEAISQRFNIG